LPIGPPPAIIAAMNAPASIVIAAVILAAAGLFGFRYELVQAPGGLVRLDRWTGRVELCRADQNVAIAAGAAYKVPPIECGATFQP
jgi:hypothetical protein